MLFLSTINFGVAIFDESTLKEVLKIEDLILYRVCCAFLICISFENVFG